MSAEHDYRSFPPIPPEGPRPFAAPPTFSDPVEVSESDEPIRFDWRKNLALFGCTLVSVFFAGKELTGGAGTNTLAAWLSGWTFAVPLLTILVCHEFGHYIAARLHRVPASLPYFLPLPGLSPFGTFGAIILMPKRIRSRRALLDIGAAGPLAGMAVAVPIMLYGLSLSTVGPRATSNYFQEGQSLLYFALKYLTFGPIPETLDVQLHPTAFAAWAGFLVTFLNLMPFGQLDGGHVAYALFGERQNRFSRWLPFLPLLVLAYNFFVYTWPAVKKALAFGFSSLGPQELHPAASSLGTWIMLFILLSVMKRFVGFEHPPVDDQEMGIGRKCVAVLTLGLFVLLFMPSPMISF
jgi:membrane-associated protease RseP (regulator of RpoE activity)